MTDEDREARWTGTFARLPSDKRARVLEAAKRAFAANGYSGANVNKIAAEAGISVGSMYKYFRTKEDLFLALIEDFHRLIESSIDAILARETRFLARVEALLRAAAETSAADPENVRIYICCTTEELAPLAARLSGNIEAASAGRYRAMVVEAQAKGEVDPSVDPAWAAFFLDDLFLLLQYSYGSEYYRERLRVFLGVPELPDPGTAVARLLGLAARALGAVA